MEIIEYLEEVNEPKCVREIAEALDREVTLIFHAMKQLLKYNEVAFVELDRETATMVSGRKVNRRTSFYFAPGLENPLQILGLADPH